MASLCGYNCKMCSPGALIHQGEKRQKLRERRRRGEGRGEGEKQAHREKPTRGAGRGGPERAPHLVLHPPSSCFISASLIAPRAAETSQ